MAGKFKLSGEELDNVADGCGNDGETGNIDPYENCIQVDLS